jgi:hypothetical protein
VKPFSAERRKDVKPFSAERRKDLKPAPLLPAADVGILALAAFDSVGA